MKMRLGKRLIEQLQMLEVNGDLPISPDAPLQVVARLDNLSVSADVLDSSRIGCVLHSLSMCNERPGELNGAAVINRAEAIARQVTYLIEPLKLLERDRAGQRALLRSAPPRETADAVEYYEAWLNRVGSGAMSFSLNRYHHGNDDVSRRAIPIVLTNEVLERLVDDLAAIIAVQPGE